jgi:PKD repeat protein
MTISIEKLSPLGVPFVSGPLFTGKLVDFTGAPLVVDIFDIVSFTAIIDPSVYILSTLWDFGDGNTSSELNPTHGYHSTGTFTVSLTVFTLGDQSIIEVKYFYILVNQPESPVVITDFGNRASNLLIEEVRKQYGETRSSPAVSGDADYVPPIEPVVPMESEPIIDLADRAVNLLIENVRKQYGQR